MRTINTPHFHIQTQFSKKSPHEIGRKISFRFRRASAPKSATPPPDSGENAHHSSSSSSSTSPASSGDTVVPETILEKSSDDDTIVAETSLEKSSDEDTIVPETSLEKSSDDDTIVPETSLEKSSDMEKTVRGSDVELSSASSSITVKIFCEICNIIIKPEKLVELHCGHIYHYDCIVNKLWMCPECNTAPSLLIEDAKQAVSDDDDGFEEFELEQDVDAEEVEEPTQYWDADWEDDDDDGLAEDVFKKLRLGGDEESESTVNP